MPFNSQKFLNAILQMSATQAPVQPTQVNTDFAKFLAANSFGITDATDAAVLGAQNDDNREKGALANTFGWLMSGMNAVENSLMDVTDSNQSVGEKIGHVGGNALAGLAHILQPVAEVAAIPGVETPWEPNALSNYIEKENTEYHGTGDISGSRILSDRLGLEGHSTGENIYKGGLGLGLDIALDPLTYVGGLGLISKLKPASKVLEDAAAGKKLADIPETVPGPFVKPASQPVDLNAGRAPMESLIPENLATPKSVTGMPKLPVSREILQKNLNLPLGPEDLRQIKFLTANDYKQYEKLRPIVYPEKVIPHNPNFAAQEAAGSALHVAAGTPRALTRSEQVDIFGQALAKSVESGIEAKTAAQQKYLIKGLEDNLEAQGFSFPEGRLSQYLHHTKSTDDLKAFAEGKPLKERPMDADVEQKMLEANKAKGRSLLEAKLFKNDPGTVFSPKTGINSREVLYAINRLSAEGAEKVYEIPKATDPKIISTAVDTAERYRGMLGKSSAVKRNPELNPANQANLYSQLYKATEKILPKKFAEGMKIPGVSKKGLAWRRDTALSMLKTAEDHLAAKYGLKGQHWDRRGLKLSSVIEALGPKVTDEHLTKVLDAFRKGDPSLVKDPIAKEAIVEAMARRNMEVGAVAKIVMDNFVEKSRVYESAISSQKFLEWKNGPAVREAKLALSAAGATPAEVSAVIDVLKNHVDTQALEMLEPMQVMDAVGSATVKAVMSGHADAKLIKKMNKAIRDAVGETPREQSLDIRARTAFTTWMTRLTTWYGRGDMVPHSQEATSYYENFAKARAEWFNDKAKNYTPEEHLTAFKAAQGHFTSIEKGMAAEGVETPLLPERTAKLAAYYKDYFENIVASTRTINDVDKLKGSVAVRANIIMEDVNKQLKAVGSSFQFRNDSKIKTAVSGRPAAGGEGYGGDNWLAYWENVDPTKMGQDPVHFMYDLSLAIDRVTAQYNMVDEFAMRFGKYADDGGFDPLTHTSGLVHERVDPKLRFDKDVAAQFRHLLNDMEKGSWIPDSQFIRAYVKGLRVWKTGVTQYNPSFHWRNAMGDAFLMWMAGHNNPAYFKTASRMIAANRHRYKEAVAADSLDQLMGLVGKEEFGVLHSKDTDIVLDKYGSKLRNAEIYGEATQRGLLPDATRASDIFGDPLFDPVGVRDPSVLKRIVKKPLGGHAHNAAMGLTEVREHTIRLAHFTSAINKKMTPAMGRRLRAIEADDSIANKVDAKRKVLERVYDEAAREVRKWHPDGRDLSFWEQKYMRNIIPFYSWQRKVIPLIAEMFVTRPAKLTVFPKGMFAAQTMLGIPAPGPSDPFPTDQLFPDWMRAEGIGPIGDPQSSNPVTAWWGKLGNNAFLPGVMGEYGYTVINPGNPFNDEITMAGMGDPASYRAGVGSLFSPAFNVPAQAMTGTNWTGAPIDKAEGGAGYGSWAASQIPILSLLNRVPHIGGKQPPSYVEDKSPDTEALLNILTALGIRGSGQYLKSAQFDARK